MRHLLARSLKVEELATQLALKLVWELAKRAIGLREVSSCLRVLASEGLVDRLATSMDLIEHSNLGLEPLNLLLDRLLDRLIGSLRPHLHQVRLVRQ
jgi:hypothetical protein